MVKHIFQNYKIIIFFTFFILISWFFFTYRITDVPPGINGDEASVGYNAILVAKNGYDSKGKFLPIFVSTSENSDWKQPITFYATVLAFKIFGPSYALFREVSVFFVLVSAILIFFLSQEILGSKAGLLSMIIFITIPAVLIQSHLNLENIAPVPFITLWLLMLRFYQKNLEQRYLYLAGIFLGISIFSYPGMRIIFPVFFLMTLYFLSYLNRNKNFMKKLTATLSFIIVALIFPILLLLTKNQYPGAVLSNNRPHGVQSYQEFLLPFISSFDPSFLFIQGDSTPYHSTGRQGVFLLATLPLFLLGIFSIARKKDQFLIFILLVFLFAPLLYGLPGSIHRGSRLLVLLPPFTIITSLGFMKLLGISKKSTKYIVVTLVSLLIITNYADFVRDYWFDYPQRVESEFAKPYHIVFEKAEQLSKAKNLTPYIQSDFRVQNRIAEDFFEQVYFPAKLKLWREDQPVPGKSVVIVSDSVLTIRSNVSQEKIDDFGFGLLINQSNEIK